MNWLPPHLSKIVVWLDGFAAKESPGDYKSAMRGNSLADAAATLLRECAGFLAETFPQVDWAAYDPQEPLAFPLLDEASRADFEGSGTAKIDDWRIGKLDAPLVRDAVLGQHAKTLKRLAPRGQVQAMIEGKHARLQAGQAAEVMALRREAFEAHRQELYEGTIRAWAFNVTNGELTLIPGTWFGSVGAVESVVAGRHPSGGILVEAKSSDGKSSAANSGPSNSRLIKDATNWFVELRKASPDKQDHSVDEYRAFAVSKFSGLKPNGAKTAWNRAAEECPKRGWSKPGRRRGKTIER